MPSIEVDPVGALCSSDGQPDVNAAAVGHLIFQMTDYSEGEFAETNVAGPRMTTRDPSRAPLVATVIGPLCANAKAAGSATSQDAENGMLVVEETSFALSARGSRHDPSVESFVIVPVHASGCGNANNLGAGVPGGPMHTLDSTGSAAVAFAENQQGELRQNLVDAQLNAGGGKPGQGYPAVLVEEAYQCHGSNVGPMGTLRAGNGNETGGVPFIAGDDPVVFQTRIARNGRGQPKDVVDSLTSSDGEGTHGDSKPHVAGRFGVRRLTPRECERCQGMPDDFTMWGIDENGKKNRLSDSARYKLIGNSVAIPNVFWIMKRIADAGGTQ